MNKENIVFNENNCPVTATAKIMGGKWKLILLHAINLTSPARFGELKRSITGITKTVLTAQLRELEEDGIIARKIYMEIPPKVEYTLTDLGRSLTPIVQQMSEWGYRYRLNKQEKPV